MARIYLIDSLFHIFRSFHALPSSLTAPDGTPTNAVHGVLGILRNLWKSERVGYAVAVFESLSGVFREEIDPDYKAHREPPDPRLKEQIPLVREVLEALGIPTMSVEGYEADDVIGTLARRAVEAGHRVTIFSNDKDMAQLMALGPEVEMLRMHGAGKRSRVERIQSGEVQKVFGVQADRIPSLLALKGDAVDNIKGLKGVGQKTAVKMLTECRNLDELLDQPERAGRFAKALVENRDRLLKDLDLATIRTNVDLGFEGFPLDSFRPAPFNGAATAFYRRMGMNRHLAGIEGLLLPEPTVSDIWF